MLLSCKLDGCFPNWSAFHTEVWSFSDGSHKLTFDLELKVVEPTALSPAIVRR